MRSLVKFLPGWAPPTVAKRLAWWAVRTLQKLLTPTHPEDTTVADHLAADPTLPGIAADLMAMVDPAAWGDHLGFAAFLDEVRQRREVLGLSIAEVSRRMGVDHAAVSRLEAGRQPNPTVNSLMRYVEAVGFRVSWGIAERTHELPIPRGEERRNRQLRAAQRSSPAIGGES